ncbi:glycosyltransferase [Paraburkholderia sp. RCC_158]|uniref:glycosyltransferase n=1 Tax=Paraburkholderia sp. RCC_158 TaxID=3239220 RepID=UPI00352413B1
MTGLVVFVTRELFPFTGGGIGRVIANILDLPEFSSNVSNADRQCAAVVFLGDGLDPSVFHSRFPAALFVDASTNTYVEIDENRFRYPPASQYTTHALHGESVRAMQALKRLERDRGPLRYVEFPDWGATAFASVQEKRLGLAFDETILAIRLHTSDSMLNATEQRAVDHSSLVLYDLERKSLADCDLVIGQVPASARAMQSFFDFGNAEWIPRLVINPPPVKLDHVRSAEVSIVPQSDTPIVFSSKVQRIKRPDVFVRGASDFLRGNPGYTGTVRVVAAAPDKEYLREIQRLVPEDLANRFEFLNESTPESRAQLISRSVCVFPGTFESFCLAAYEASRSGAFCLLNETNPAYSAGSPWKDGVNCAKFDGTSSGLVRALSDVFRRGHSVEIVTVHSDIAPWRILRPIGRAEASSPQDWPLVSVLIPHFNLGSYIERTIESALASDYPNVEVIVVDDASTDAASVATIRELMSRKDARIRVVAQSSNRGLAATRNIAVQHARGEFSLTLDADDLIDARFIGIAALALSRDPKLSFVVPQTAYFDSLADPMSQHCSGLRCMTFVGEARASGIFQNKFATATIMARTSELRALRYDESLSAYEDWDMYMRATMSGRRFVVTNALHFYYRHRRDSMIHGEEAAAKISLFYHDLMRTKYFVVGQNRLPMYALEGAAVAQYGESLDHLRARIAAYENSLFVAAALSVRRGVDRLPTWVRNLIRWLAGAARRRNRRRT